MLTRSIQMVLHQKYKINKLIYYEAIDDVYSAISREKQIKNWKREWKIQLKKIQSMFN